MVSGNAALGLLKLPLLMRRYTYFPLPVGLNPHPLLREKGDR
jgi:hypothetical protein